eukprot:scaffold6555_cov182-Amphora_coffeaeformis.AAC.8
MQDEEQRTNNVRHEPNSLPYRFCTDRSIGSAMLSLSRLIIMILLCVAGHARAYTRNKREGLTAIREAPSSSEGFRGESTLLNR